MKFVFSSGVLLCILLPVTVCAQGTQVDWLRGTDFSRFQTFTWATGVYPIQDQNANLGFAGAVQDELERKNVKLVDPRQKFDLFVTNNVQINPDLKDGSRKLITVNLRILDSRNNAVVW